jgi:microsomal dipeptidase-like Zn-dependent dipeptidase
MGVPRYFDAHLDLAYLAETGRDMLSTPRDDHGHPAALTLHSLRESPVRRAVATIFVQPRGPDAAGHDVDGSWCYSSVNEAHAQSMRQIHQYHRWRDLGLLNILDGTPANDSANLEVLMLLEGAAGLRTPADLGLFYSNGVRILALTWVNGTRWAGGDQSGGDVTADGLTLLALADSLAMIHDVSHLSEQAFWTVMENTQRPKIASHSNCRELLPGKHHPERHLSNPQILALAGYNGVIGINLFSRFLVSSGVAQIHDVVRHIQHIVDLTGRTDIVGLGSDIDGGFSALDLPRGIRRPADLPKIGDALSAAGFSDLHIEQFAWSNWNSFFQRAGLLG